MPRSEILARGPVAGAIGVTVMALAEKLGQAFAKQPSSYVPAHILERLLGLSHRADHERLLLNWAMHVCLPLLDNGRWSLFAELDFENEVSAADFCCDSEHSNRHLGLI